MLVAQAGVKYHRSSKPVDRVDGAVFGASNSEFQLESKSMRSNSTGQHGQRVGGSTGQAGHSLVVISLAVNLTINQLLIDDMK